MPKTNNSRMKNGAVRSLLFRLDTDRAWMFIRYFSKEETPEDARRHE